MNKSKATSLGRVVAANAMANGVGGQGAVSDEAAERACNWTGPGGQGTKNKFYVDDVEAHPMANGAGFSHANEYRIYR